MSKQLIFSISTLFLIQLSVYYWGYTINVAEQEMEERMKQLFSEEFENPIEVSKLDLSNLGLTYLPDCFEVFTNIDSLNLSNNKLTNAPSIIKAFNELKHLDLSHNQLTQIPSKIIFKRTLTSINLSHNQFQSIGFNKDFNLIKNIDLSYNQLTSIVLPSNYYEEFDNINLSNNQLETIRFDYFIDNIQTLSLSNNRLNDIDLSFCSSTQNLDISNNQLENINIINDDSKIRMLYCNDNNIQNITPESILSKKISGLDISNNPIESLAKDLNVEMLALTDLKKSMVIENDSITSLDIRSKVDSLTIRLKAENLYCLTVNEYSLSAILNGENKLPSLKNLTIVREIYDKNDPPKAFFEFQEKYPTVEIYGFEIDKPGESNPNLIIFTNYTIDSSPCFY